MAGYMVQYAGGWRNFIFLCAALAGFNAILMFFLMPESNFNRSLVDLDVAEKHTVEAEQELKSKLEVYHGEQAQPIQLSHANAESGAGTELFQVEALVSKKFSSFWFSPPQYNKDIHFSTTLIRPFALLSYPSVLWASFIFGGILAPNVPLM